MADNTELNAGAGGDTIAADDILGIKFQRVKLVLGADGVNDGDVAAGNPVPVTGTVTTGGLTDAQLRATPVPVSGPLTDTQLRATAVPVSGTVTANAGSGPFPVSDNAGSLTVDNATLSVVGGGVEATALRVTLASDSTGVVSVDDNGGALTVDGTVAAAQSGAWTVRLSDGTDTADVFDLTNSNPLTVAIVDGNGDQITSFGGSGGTSQADKSGFTDGTTAVTPIGGVYNEAFTDLAVEDIAAAIRVNPKRHMMVSLRDEGDGAVTSAAANAVRVSPVDSNGVLTSDTTANAWRTWLVDDSGNSVTNDTANAVRVQIVDANGVAAVNEDFSAVSVVGTEAVDAALSTATILSVGGRASTATPTAVSADGDVQAVWLTRNGALNVADGGSTLSIDDGAGSITVDGSLTTVSTVTTITNVVHVDDNAGSLTVDGTVTANAGSGTFTVGGVAAADAATSGNPVQIAGQMETMADSAPGTRMSADGDVNRPAMTDGALYVITTGPQAFSYHEDSSSALTDTTVHSAPGAGLSIYVQSIAISLGAATALNVFFEEGSTKVLGPYYLEAVNGRTLNLNFLCPKKITANTALTVTTSAAVAHSIDITGFIAPG